MGRQKQVHGTTRIGIDEARIAPKTVLPAPSPRSRSSPRLPMTNKSEPRGPARLDNGWRNARRVRRRRWNRPKNRHRTESAATPACGPPPPEPPGQAWWGREAPVPSPSPQKRLGRQRAVVGMGTGGQTIHGLRKLESVYTDHFGVDPLGQLHRSRPKRHGIGERNRSRTESSGLCACLLTDPKH